MRCYYEVLCAEPSATPDELKKCYRKQALRHHPDKNGGSEEAEARFKEVQEAWEALSDPKERAWYDDHRESILRGEAPGQGGGEGGGGGRGDEPNLWPYFHAGAFKGYGDGPQGFYATYARAFEEVAASERAAAARQVARASTTAEQRAATRAEGAAVDLPRFGGSGEPHERVSAFYRVWAGFVSCKVFAWADKYNPNEAPSRFVRRRMEEDNRRARKHAKREYVDQIRELVEFVKRRDKRFVAAAAAAAARDEERERERRKRQAAQQKQRQAAAKKAAEEAAAMLAAMGAAEEDECEFDDIEEEVYECVVCDKIFKYSKQLKKHERSKAHLEAMEALRQEMLAEMEEEDMEEGKDGESDSGSSSDYGGGGDDGRESESSGGGKESECGIDESESEELLQARHQPAAGSRPNTDIASEAEGDEDEDGDDDDDEDAALARMMRTSANVITRAEQSDESESEPADVCGFGDGASVAAQAQAEAHRSKADAGGGAPANEASADEEDGAEAAKGLAEASHDAEGADEHAGQAGNKNVGAAKNDARKSRKEVRKLKKKLKAALKGGGAGGDSATTCQVCAEAFSSRTALFRHIRETGHAALRSA